MKVTRINGSVTFSIGTVFEKIHQRRIIIVHVFLVLRAIICQIIGGDHVDVSGFYN